LLPLRDSNQHPYLQLGTVDLSNFFQEMIEIGKRAHSKQLHIIIDVPPDLSPIRVDRTRLQEPSTNLVDTREFRARRGEIRLRARQRYGENCG